MNKDMLSYYNEELDYLRTAGSQFGNKHPKIAGSLRIDQNRVQDPMVTRLIESFAFLTAKLSHQLDGDNIELAQTLLNLMYPHLLQPVPSLSTVQLKPAIDVVSPVELARGSEMLASVLSSEMGSAHASKCCFRTCYAVSVVPFSVDHVVFMRRGNIRAHGLPIQSKACIHLQLTKTCPDDLKPSLDVTSLRFYINVQQQYANLLYECIFNKVLQVVFYSRDLKKSVTLDSSVIKTVGFSDNEDLLNFPGNAFDGFRMLTEYSAFTDKFMYLDVSCIQDVINQLGTCEFDILFCMDDYHSELDAAINDASFMLNCTPIINLFQANSDVIKIDHKHATYHLTVDSSRSPWETEIYRVSNLKGCSENGDEIILKPRYGLKYNDVTQNNCTAPLVYWDVIRKPTWHFGVEHQSGHEVMLRFILDETSSYQLDMNQCWTLMADCWCTNRDLPSKMVVSEDSKFSLATQFNSLLSVHCLCQPTVPIRPDLDNTQYWQLLAALAGSQQALSDVNFGLENLKSIISSLNVARLDEIDLIMDNMLKLSVERASCRYPCEQILTFVRGLKMTIEFTAGGMARHDLFLFGTVLSRFLNQYCALDSFIILQFNQQHQGQVFVWQPQFGKQPLI